MKIGLDLDGTLISCKEKHVALIACLCKAVGVELDMERWWNLKQGGLNGEVALERLGVSQNAAKTLLLQWQAYIETYPWLAFDKILPGIIDTLNHWRNNGFELHLVSARANQELAYEQLRRLMLRDLFSTVTFVSPSNRQAKSEQLKKLTLDIYFGDTEADFLSAVNASVTPGLVSTGMRSSEYLLRTTGTSPLLALPKTLKHL